MGKCRRPAATVVFHSMLHALLASSTLFLQQLINGAVLGGLYALIALAYSLVYGVARLVNFAHGEIYLFGAFIFLSLLSGFFGVVLSFGPALLGAVAFCALLGVLLDKVFFRPLRRAPALAGLMTTIGLSVILQNLALLIWGSRSRIFFGALVPAFFARPALQSGGLVVSWFQVIIIAATAGTLAGLQLLLYRTRFGRAVRAVSQDRTAAALVGVNVDRVVSGVFAIAAILAGLAGIMAGCYCSAISPAMGYTAGIKGFSAAVVGGLGSLPGAVLGGGICGLVEAFGAGYISSPYHEGLVFVTMIVILLLKPGGLAGRKS